MKNPGTLLWVAALILLGPAPTFAQSASEMGKGQALVTLLPKASGQLPVGADAGDQPAPIMGKDLVIQVNGKEARVTGLLPRRSPDSSLEFVLLIDSSAGGGIGSQFQEIQQFIRRLPPNSKAAIAYMHNGSAVFASPLSADRDQVLRGLHLPVGSAGSSASPYFCLSDLAKHWPSTDREARREVVMISNGIDPYDRPLDYDDAYLQTAVNDSLRSGLVVYSIYWHGLGGARSRFGNAGQSLMNIVTEATGGVSYGSGLSNPISFQPFFDDLLLRFRNQFQLEFVGDLRGKPHPEELKLKLNAQGIEVSSPHQVMIYPVTGEQM